VHEGRTGGALLSHLPSKYYRRNLMKKLQVLESSCPKCEELAKNTDEALKASEIYYELGKVADLNKSCPSRCS